MINGQQVMSVQFEWQTGEAVGEPGAYPRTSRRRGFAWLWLALLAVLAFGLGMAIGIGWRYKQAQQTLWADLEGVVAELRTHLADGNRSAFLALTDPEDTEWLAYQLAWWGAWQESGRRPALPIAVQEVEFDGERAEVTVVLGQREERWLARWDFVLRKGRWFLARPHWAAWGSPAEITAAHLALRYRDQDGEMAQRLAPTLNDFAAQTCRWIGTPPERCRVIVELTADVTALGTPVQAAEKRLFRPSLAPPALLDSLRGDDQARVLSPVPLPLARDAIRMRLGARNLGRAFGDFRVVQPSEPWARSAWRLRGQEEDAALWMAYPSPTWSGWRAGGEVPAQWLLGLRRELAEAMVRDRLGLLVGRREDMNGAWALAIGIAEWLAEPQDVGGRALPWAPLAAVGQALQGDPINSEELRRQAREAATYIAMTWGPETFGPLLEALGKYSTLDEALSQVLNVDRRAFEAGWRAFRDRGGVSPAHPS